MVASTHKKRGAPPGNKNALKHGIYSRYYTPRELRALDRDVAGSLKDETEILRLLIAETGDSILAQPEADVPFLDNVSSLRTIAVSIARLENVTQIRMVVFGDPDRREKQVDAVLDAMEQAEMDGTLSEEDLPQPDDISLASSNPSTLTSQGEAGSASSPQKGGLPSKPLK